MSLSRSNCMLLGFGASAPPINAGVVLGGAASVCYLGGSAPGATVSAAALSLKAGTQLDTAAGAGAVGAPLLSGGAAAPAWSATSVFYVYSANSTLAAGTSGQLAILKNNSSGSITVTGTGTGFIIGTAAAVPTLTMASGASVLLTSNGTNWLQTYMSGPRPTVTGVSPVSGPLAGGTSITITGTAFTGATAVSVGGHPATSVSVDSGTSITATAPAGTAGNASVLVTTPSGTSAANDLFTYYATTSTYNYTGANQEFVVPFNCTISASVAGSAGIWGANGAVITGTFTATAGSKLAIVVGQYNSTYAGGTNDQRLNGGGGGYSAVINDPSNVNSNGTPIANEPNCIYIMAGGGGGGVIGYGLYRDGTGGLWNANANPMSHGGGSDAATGGYTTNYIGDGAGGVGINDGAKFTGGNGYGGAGGYYGGGGHIDTGGGGGGGSSYVNQSVTAVTSAATNGDAGTVTLTIVQ